MPKINVYLPDELAEAVKEAGVPVSAICQRALEQAVRRVVAARQLASSPLDPSDDRFPMLTARAREVLRLALTAAGPGAVGTGHLLEGMVAEGDNLAVRVLPAIDISPQAVLSDLRRDAPARQDSASEGGSPGHLSAPAARALETAVSEAASLGHNYVGCEHLLLALIAEPDGVAGQALRARGAELRLTRRAVSAALAGYVHLRAQQGGGEPAHGFAELLQEQLQPLLNRIERLEERLQ